MDTPDFPEEFKAEAGQGADALALFQSISDLDWTYVSPAAFIHPGERTGHYRLGEDELLVDESGSSEVSAEDATRSRSRISSSRRLTRAHALRSLGDRTSPWPAAPPTASPR